MEVWTNSFDFALYLYRRGDIIGGLEIGRRNRFK